MYAYLLYYILGFVMIPGIIMGIIAQIKVKTTFDEYNQVSTQRGNEAQDVARKILNGGDCLDTKVVQTRGELTDHYNPKTDTVSLSESVYGKNTVAAVGVALHEVGHVFQHKQNYAPIKIRNSLVPVINFSSFFMWPLIIIGLILEIVYFSTFAEVLIYIGVGIYGLNTLFCLITLPVELNASKRAYKTLISTHELTEEEAKGVKKVLNAAAWTYVAALITSILSLLRVLLFIFSIRGDRN